METSSQPNTKYSSMPNHKFMIELTKYLILYNQSPLLSTFDITKQEKENIDKSKPKNYLHDKVRSYWNRVKAKTFGDHLYAPIIFGLLKVIIFLFFHLFCF